MEKRKRRRLPNLLPSDKRAIADDYTNKRLKVKVIAANHGRALSTINGVIAEMGAPRRYNLRKVS